MTLTMKILRALHQTNVWLYSLFDLDVSFCDPNIPKVNNIIIIYKYIFIWHALNSCMINKYIFKYNNNAITFWHIYRFDLTCEVIFCIGYRLIRNWWKYRFQTDVTFYDQIMWVAQWGCSLFSRLSPFHNSIFRHRPGRD